MIIQEKRKKIAVFAAFCIGMLIIAYELVKKLIARVYPFDEFGWMCLFIVIAIIALPIVLYLLAFVFKAEFHWCYLAAGLTLGIIFMFFIPPYATPDEVNHTWSTYYVSDKILGYGETADPDATILVRKGEAGAPLSTVISRRVYNDFLHNAFVMEEPGFGELVDSYQVYSTPHLLYFIPAIGVTIGRIFHWGAVPSILLGTLLNVLFFVLSATYAMKKIPFGKMILASVCLLPMTLQQTSSLSYDNAIITSSIVIIALGIKWCFSEENIEKNEIVAYFIFTFILLIAKGGIYATVCLLPFLYRFSKAKNKKMWQKYKVPIILLIIMVIVVLGTGKVSELAKTMFDSASTADSVESATENVNIIQWAGEEGYTVSWILENPFETIRIFVMTFVLNWRFYLHSLIGDPLGWMQLSLSNKCVYAFIAIGLLSTISSKSDKIFMSAGNKVLLFGSTFVTALLCALAMFLFYSPKSYGVILGLQGRYFLPFYLAILLCFRNRKISIKYNIEKILLIANVFLCSYVVVNFLHGFSFQ